MDRMKYYYPDDVVAWTDIDGTRRARIGFTVEADDTGNVTIKSDYPAIFTASDTAKLHVLFEPIWLEARERHRRRTVEDFLAGSQTVQRDRASWAAFTGAGNEPSITAWRAWQAH